MDLVLSLEEGYARHREIRTVLEGQDKDSLD